MRKTQENMDHILTPQIQHESTTKAKLILKVAVGKETWTINLDDEKLLDSITSSLTTRTPITLAMLYEQSSKQESTDSESSQRIQAYAIAPLRMLSTPISTEL